MSHMPIFVIVVTLCGHFSDGARIPVTGSGCGQSHFAPKIPTILTEQEATQNATLGVGIVGGDVAEPHSWPWMAALFIKGEYQCGGTLISDSWIMTAAHCLLKKQVPVSKDDVTVKLAVVNVEKTNPEEQVVKAKQLVRHDGYEPKTYVDDIALIELETPVTINEYVSTVCLPDTDDIAMEATLGIATGWGYISEFGPMSDLLRQVFLPVVLHSTCVADLAPKLVNKNMLCAGPLDGGADACQADSGGPFVVHSAHRQGWVQQGIVSWGDGCAEPNKPGVYTAVPSYKDWINNIIQNNNNNNNNS